MDRIELNHCRFCAEPKDPDKLFNLRIETAKCQDIITKLTYLNAIYVDITNDILPKTICFICYESLNQTYMFLNTVKEAQYVLSKLYLPNKKASFDMVEEDEIYFDASMIETESIKLETVDVKFSPPRDSGELEVECSGPEDDTSSILSTSQIKSPNIQDAALPVAATTSKVINKNVINSWKNYTWICADCNLEFPDIALLREHSKTEHRKCSGFKCADCKAFYFRSFNTFIKHVTSHRMSLQNLCFYCNVKPRNSSVHLNKHMESENICPACGDTFETEEALRKHLDHFNKKTHTIADCTCQICGKVLHTPYKRKEHLKLHRNDRKKEFSCERCGKTFFSKGSLVTHTMSHDQIRPHTCKICNGSFMFLSRLRKHVQTHSSEKPFSCDDCGRQFRFQNQLNNHKIIHTNQMPYKCQYCDKGFRFRTTWTTHLRQHTGAKPYSCDQCEMEFTNWPNYNKHMKQKHGKDTSKKKNTPEGVFPVNPETGQVLQVQADLDEWKNEIMISKRGKKNVIKKEKTS